MQRALEELGRQLAGVDSLGSRAYARFVEPRAGDLDASARRASGAVNALLKLI